MQNTLTYLAVAPRRVPLSLRIVNVFGGLSQLGWGILLFGSIFFWPFGGQADLSFLTFDGGGRAMGRVTGFKETGASENDQKVMATHYEYSVAGRTFTGTSYTTDALPAEAAPVEVEYDASDPATSRIAGMRRAVFGPWTLLVGILPLAGAILVYFGMRSGMKRNRLLRNGLLASGKLVSREETNVTVNRRRLWKLTFEFVDRLGQRHQAVAATTAYERLEDEAAEPLLYDADDPQRAYVLDELPARPRVEGGELVGRGASAVFVLILPAIVIAVNALIVTLKLGVMKLP